MRRRERFLWGVVGLLGAVVLVAAVVSYGRPLLGVASSLRGAGHVLQALGLGPVAPDGPGLQVHGHDHENLIDYWTCSMHPSVKRGESGICPICSMDLVPVYRPEAMTEDRQAPPGTGPTPEERATFRIDPTWQQAIAVTTAPAETRILRKTLRTVGHVAVDENLLTDVDLKLSGWIRRLHVAETGQFVERGQPLFELYSPELVSTAREYRLALDHLERVAESPEEEVVERARSLVEATRQRLRFWDLAAEQIDGLGQSDVLPAALPVLSPAAGYVVEKAAVEGMRVTPGTRLYRIADLSRVWVLADVYESEVSFIREGQPATVEVTHRPGRSWTGRVDYIYPTVKPATRTVQVRLVFPNPGLTLQPDTYVDVVLEARTTPVLAVPREAVLDLGLRKVVFVDLGEGRLQAREVAVGPEAGGFVPIRAGLREGESVVTSGNFLVDAESKVRGVVPLPVEENR